MRCADGAISGVDGGRIVADAVHDEAALRDVVVDKGVGVFASLDRTNLLQGFQIDDSGGVRVTVGGEPAAEVGRERHSVSIRQTGDFAHDGARVNVYHVDVIVTSDVETPGTAVHGDVVPAFGATDGDAIQEVVAGWAGLVCCILRTSGEEDNRENQRCSNCNSSASVIHGDASSDVRASAKSEHVISERLQCVIVRFVVKSM